MAELQLAVDAAVDFLVGMLNVPSPTGFTADAVDYTARGFAALDLPGANISVTGKGALLLTLPGRASSARRGVTAHVDTLGLMVRAIKPDGRLKVVPLGGIMWGGVEMEGVTVRTFDDRRFRGTLLPENPSVHVNAAIQRSERSASTMEIRLDERTASAAETRALGIEVGDFVFVDPRVETSASGFIRGRFLDNKAGIACIYAALRALYSAGQQPAQDTAVLIANYEEAGHGGYAGWPYELAELLVVDMGALGQDQNSDEFSVSICVRDGGGPYDHAMSSRLRRLAAAHSIAFKPDIYINYSSDGTAYWRAGGGARVGLIGPGVDASHAYERTHRDALQHTSHLIARYLLDADRANAPNPFHGSQKVVRGP